MIKFINKTKTFILMAVAVGVAGFNTARAGNPDVLVGFNDAAGPTAANNDYVIDLGMAGPDLLTAATNAGGTIVFTNFINSVTNNSAFSGDPNAANNVAVGVVCGSTIAGADYIFQTSRSGISALPTGYTPTTAPIWLQAAGEAQTPEVGEYSSAGPGGSTYGWSQIIAVSPTTQGSSPGGNFAGNCANPMANLVGGQITLPFFESTGTGGRNFVPSAWTQVGSFKIDVNTGNITFSTGGSAPPPPTVTSVTGSVTNGFAPLTVVFAATTTGTVTNYVWSFGDGNSVTNTTASATNTYAANGSYTVSLTANGPGGSGTLALANYIVVSSTPIISSFGRSGGQFSLNGGNGPAGVQYRILSATNIKTPLASWVPVYTNNFSGTGGFSFSIPTTNSASYFKLVSP